MGDGPARTHSQDSVFTNRVLYEFHLTIGKRFISRSASASHALKGKGKFIEVLSCTHVISLRE